MLKYTLVKANISSIESANDNQMIGTSNPAFEINIKPIILINTICPAKMFAYKRIINEMVIIAPNTQLDQYNTHYFWHTWHPKISNFVGSKVCD
jgi:hypothetical protein